MKTVPPAVSIGVGLVAAIASPAGSFMYNEIVVVPNKAVMMGVSPTEAELITESDSGQLQSLSWRWEASSQIANNIPSPLPLSGGVVPIIATAVVTGMLSCSSAVSCPSAPGIVSAGATADYVVKLVPAVAPPAGAMVSFDVQFPWSLEIDGNDQIATASVRIQVPALFTLVVTLDEDQIEEVQFTQHSARPVDQATVVAGNKFSVMLPATFQMDVRMEVSASVVPFSPAPDALSTGGTAFAMADPLFEITPGDPLIGIVEVIVEDGALVVPEPSAGAAAFAALAAVAWLRLRVPGARGRCATPSERRRSSSRVRRRAQPGAKLRRTACAPIQPRRSASR